MSYFVNYIINKQNKSNEDILNFGSLGGGFMPIMFAILFHNKCSVIDPQLFVKITNLKQLKH